MENSLNDVFSRRPGNETDFNNSWNRIILLRDADQAERALAEAGRMCVAFPDSAPAHFLLAACLCDVGRRDEARAECLESLRLDPNEVRALRLCARLVRTPAESRDLLRRAVELDPHDGPTLIDLAVTEQQTSIRRRRWRELERLALEAAPKDIYVLMTAARLEGGGTTRRGNRLLSRAAALDTDNPNVLLEMSETATSVRRVRELSKTLSAALAASPTDPVLNRAVDHLVLRIHRIGVPFSIMAEAATAVMPRSLGYDPDLNIRMIFLSSWGMFGMVMAIISVPVLLGLGPRTAMFMRLFYRTRPVKRALMRTTLILAPVQLGVILITGDLDAIGASAALSLIITTGVFAYQKRAVKRRRRADPRSEEPADATEGDRIMKVDEVADFLVKEGVRPRLFAINTVAADDAVVLYQEGPARWVVFYAERGDRIGEKVYDSEDAACRALIKEARFLEQEMRKYESRPRRPHPVTPKPKPVKEDPDFIVDSTGTITPTR